MALATYSDLKTAISAWYARDLSSVVADFVTLAEGDVKLDVRCSAMEQYSTGTMSGSTIDHPTGYLEARALFFGNDRHEYVTPEEYLLLSETTRKLFTSIGTKLYVLGAEGTSYTLVYYKAFTAMSGATDTTWLLTNYPGVYLSAALRHAALYMKDAMEVQAQAQAYAGWVARVNKQDTAQARPGTLRVRLE